MFKKRSFLLLIIISALVLISCGTKPEATVKSYVEAMKEFDFEKMAEFVSEDEDKEKDIKEDDDEEMAESFMEYLEENAKKIEYEILDSKTDKDKATVQVKFKYVDGSPLMAKVMQEYMEEALVYAFSDADLSDERMEEMLVSILNKEIEENEDRFVERKIDIPLKKEDGNWYISEVSPRLQDVALSNYVTLFEETQEEIEGQEGEDIELDIEEEFDLATIRVKVNSLDFTEELPGYFDEKVKAKEGTKFGVLNLDITNITKEDLSLSSDGFILLDDEDREFSVYDNLDMNLDNSLEYKKLAPAIKENGIFVYELPEDSKNFYLIMGHADTGDRYYIDLKK